MAARGYGVVAVLMALYQACLLAAIALTSPTFVALGTMLAVPVSMFVDYVLKRYGAPPFDEAVSAGNDVFCPTAVNSCYLPTCPQWYRCSAS